MTSTVARPRTTRTRRLLIAAVATVLVASPLTACGAATTAGGKAAGDSVITLSMHNPDSKTQDPATYKIVEAFNAKNPTMKVNLVGQPVEQHEQQMTIAAQSDTLPDVFWVYNSLAQTMNKNGNLLDLTPVLAESGLNGKFAPPMLAGFRNGATQYGLPYQALVTGFYYNKDLLAKNGVTLPATFEELVAASKALKAKGVVPIAQGSNNSAFSVWAFLTMLDRFGYEQKYPGMLLRASSYDNPDFLRLYEHIDELAAAGAFPSNMTTQTYVQAVASFTSGQAAFVDTGVWDAAKIQQSPVGGSVGFWPGPTFSDGVGEQKLVMNAPSAPLVVSAKVKKDKKKYEAVKAFISFYYSDEGQQIMADNAQPPVTTYKPTVDAAKNPVFADVLAATTKPGWSSPQAQPDLVVSAETASAMYDSLYGVMSRSLSPKDAVQLVHRSFK
ncbi:extracellular solute-binding protein [Kitasatospora sp. NPDC051914]|uniref:ABC transporter substrate-binding protein n=1 Tax=Kitasatospora sp. NPDC051914 TaxID=3154945 RepID=UPI0034499381